MAYGYDDTVMPDGRLLNRDDLDAAFPDNPVRVDHVSMHGAVLNSLALKQYGISADDQDARRAASSCASPARTSRTGLIMETAFLPVVREDAAADAGAGDRVDQGRRRCSTPRPASRRRTKGATHLAQLADDASAPPTPAPTSSTWWPIPSSPTSTRSSPSSRSPRWGKYDKRFKIGGVKITDRRLAAGPDRVLHDALPDRRPRRREELEGELTRPAGGHQRRRSRRSTTSACRCIFHANGDAAIDCAASRRTSSRRPAT